jgi:hypothetical protein
MTDDDFLKKIPLQNPPYFPVSGLLDKAFYDQQAKNFLQRLRDALPVGGLYEGLRLGRAVITPTDNIQRHRPRSLWRSTNEDRFRIIQELVTRWKPLGVGPVRTQYFLNVILGGNIDELGIGGFPFPGTLSFPRGDGTDSAFVSAQYISGNQWMLNDAMFADVLARLGLSWEVLEDGLSRAFRKALPENYRALLKGVPSALDFLLWKHDLECWRNFSKIGDGITEHSDALSQLISNTPISSQFEPFLHDLRQIAASTDWTRHG